MTLEENIIGTKTKRSHLDKITAAYARLMVFFKRTIKF